MMQAHELEAMVLRHEELLKKKFKDEFEPEDEGVKDEEATLPSNEPPANVVFPQAVPTEQSAVTPEAN